MFPSLQPGLGDFAMNRPSKPKVPFRWDTGLTAFKKRMEDEGRTKEFIALKRVKEREGFVGWDAYMEAANEMEPLTEGEKEERWGEDGLRPIVNDPTMPVISDEPLTEEEFWQGVTKSWRVAQVSGDGRTMTALSQLLSRHLDEVGKGGRVKKTDEELADEALEEVRKMRGE